MVFPLLHTLVVPRLRGPARPRAELQTDRASARRSDPPRAIPWSRKLPIPGVLAAFLLAHSVRGVTIQEDFSSDPALRGWQVHGEGSLFEWDSTNEALHVTWDSSRTNSYFHLPLNTVVTRNESFEASFDVKVEDIATGTTAGKPYTFPIAVCLFNIEAAERTNFFVGSGTSSSSGPRSTIEFDYFPASGDISATFALIAVPTNTNPFLYDHDFPLPLETNVWHRIALSYDASSQTVTMSKVRTGVPYGEVQSILLPETFGDFEINTFAVASYSDRVGLGSARAHGWIDNVSITVPDLPISRVTLTLTNGPQAKVWFVSATGWNYRLERSGNPTNWSAASAELAGTGSLMTLTDTNPPADHAFYRVRARRP